PEDDEGIDIDAFEALLDTCGDEVSFVYVVTVGNPSAAILSNSRRERLVHAVTRLSHQLGRKVPLLLDEAYEWLVHAGSPDEQLPTLQSEALQSEALLSGALWDELGLVYEL